jgi:hypothetical protein
MTTLQLIIKKAKALRTASPKKFAKWTDYVKAASATIKPKKKATVGAIKKKAVKKAATKKVVKKAPVKKVVKKAATKKATSIHKDSKSHNVRISVISGIKLSTEEKSFIEKEGKRSKNFKYRGKILWGSPIILKETNNGTPVEKFGVDSLEIANFIANELNKGKKYTKVKAKKI